jgi:hypothetical protein
MTPDWSRVEAHFGYGWQTKFAKHIGVTARMVRYWFSGKKETPKYVILIIGGLEIKK